MWPVCKSNSFVVFLSVSQCLPCLEKIICLVVLCTRSWIHNAIHMMANSGKYIWLSYWIIITQSAYVTNAGADSSEMQFVWVQKSMLLKMFCEFNFIKIGIQNLFNKIFLICVVLDFWWIKFSELVNKLANIFIQLLYII